MPIVGIDWHVCLLKSLKAMKNHIFHGLKLLKKNYICCGSKNIYYAGRVVAR